MNSERACTRAEGGEGAINIDGKGSRFKLRRERERRSAGSNLASIEEREEGALLSVRVVTAKVAYPWIFLARFSSVPCQRVRRKLCRGSSTSRRPLPREDFPEFVSTGFPIHQSGARARARTYTHRERVPYRWVPRRGVSRGRHERNVSSWNNIFVSLQRDPCPGLFVRDTLRKVETYTRVLLPSNQISFGQIRVELETRSLANPPGGCF